MSHFKAKMRQRRFLSLSICPLVRLSVCVLDGVRHSVHVSRPFIVVSNIDSSIMFMVLCHLFLFVSGGNMFLSVELDYVHGIFPGMFAHCFLYQC